MGLIASAAAAMVLWCHVRWVLSGTIVSCTKGFLIFHATSVVARQAGSQSSGHQWWDLRQDANATHGTEAQGRSRGGGVGGGGVQQIRSRASRWCSQFVPQGTLEWLHHSHEKSRWPVNITVALSLTAGVARRGFVVCTFGGWGGRGGG